MPDPTAPDLDADSVPRTYLGWAVVVTAVAFLPLGLIAVYYGLRAKSALADGRTADAVRAGRAARRWVIVTAIVGVVVDLVIIAALLLLGAYSS